MSEGAGEAPSEAATEPTLPDTRRREVVRQAWSVGIASGTYGISFGALAVAAGLDLWQAQLLSLAFQVPLV